MNKPNPAVWLKDRPKTKITSNMKLIKSMLKLPSKIPRNHSLVTFYPQD